MPSAAEIYFDPRGKIIRWVSRDSPDEPRLGVNICAFPAFPQDRRAVSTVTSALGSSDGVRGADLAIFLGIWAHSCRWLLLNAGPSNVSRGRGWWLRPQFCDEAQNLLEHLPGDGDLGHLERDVAGVADDLRADLDQLLFQRRQRPILDRFGRRQCEGSCRDCRPAREAEGEQRSPRKSDMTVASI